MTVRPWRFESSPAHKFLAGVKLVNKNFLYFLTLVIFFLFPGTVLAAKEAAPRSQTAQEHMSVVAKKVEELLTSTERAGGIGEQVRLIAQEQNQAQEKIQNQIRLMEDRVGWLRTLVGPNFQALKNLKKEIEQNRLRISQLEQLKNKVKNSGLETQFQTTTEALVQQNMALQEKLNTEEKTFSLLGWLAKLFVN